MTGDSDDVPIWRIERALLIAARVVAFHGEKYAPIFERIEHELDRRTRKISTGERALMIVRAHEDQTTKFLGAR